ncbi:MAG TPA: NAD(P)-dependent oxidoreductase, partial [Vicinamibacterales bacterium]
MSASSSGETIGFIGLGNMGRPMAANLCRKGFSLIVHDVNPAPVRALADLGARTAPTVAELADRSTVVITMLPTSAIVERVVAGPDGVLARLRRGGAVMDMSTIDPLVTDRLAAAAAAHGCGWIDAPVGRLASHAERGESLFMVGADDPAFARVTPLLDAMGTTVHHCGPAGTGMRT